MDVLPRHDRLVARNYVYASSISFLRQVGVSAAVNGTARDAYDSANGEHAPSLTHAPSERPSRAPAPISLKYRTREVLE